MTDTSLGVAPELLGLLAYALGWVSGLVLLLVERDHERVRFHAAQSLVLSALLLGAWLVVGVLASVPAFGSFAVPAGAVLVVVAVALWVVLLVQGHRLAACRVPLVADLADAVAARFGP